MATKFLNDTGSTYLKEMAEYLQDRYLTVEDVSVIPFATKNHGLSKEDGTPYPLMGWAFCIKGPDGLPDQGKLHLRVCNWPAEEPLYNEFRSKDKQSKLRVVNTDRPKFVQCFKDEFLYFTRPKADICHANVIMIHEKITSAELATKYLTLPGLALSGCRGWSKNGAMGKELEHTLSNLTQGCKILCCFDGDMALNPQIQEAARGLKGWIGTLRADLDVVFLAVPPNDHGVGWDDWAVAQGADLAANWANEIITQAKGVEVVDFVPAGFLIQEYQLETKETKEKGIVAVHTLDNYERLLRYPRWAGLCTDISGLIYDSNDVLGGPKSFDLTVKEYRKWLETNAYRGSGEAVRGTFAKDALETLLERNKISVPLELLGMQPEVTDEQAQEAALNLITKGMQVIGPMDQEQTVETVIRMARDMVALWSLDNAVDVQWACALVGPSGCGKSNFPHSFTSAFRDWGYDPPVGSLAKSGEKSTLTELFKACRDNLIGVFDEYDPADSDAKQVEQNLFTLSTTRQTRVRQLYKERAELLTRHAAIFLTTTDKNRSYIRSAKGTGERRFITLEVKGTTLYYGQLTSNRDVIKACGATLLRYGLQLYTAGHSESATEYSVLTTNQYISSASVLGRLGQFWAKADLPTVLAKFKEEYYRKQTEDVRFSMPMIFETLLPQEKLGRQEKADLKDFVVSMGAENMGQGRIRMGGKEVMKDEVWAVQDWEGFCERLVAKI